MKDKNQVVLPLDLGICIAEGDFVFTVAEICESLDYTELFNTYVRKWRKVNPITMFEIRVFGYMEHLYSVFLKKITDSDVSLREERLTLRLNFFCLLLLLILKNFVTEEKKGDLDRICSL